MAAKLPFANRDGVHRALWHRAYPALVCLVVLFGHILSCEMAAASLVVCLASAALFATDSILPVICPVLTLVFTLSRSHTPGLPAFSSYLFSDGRAAILALLSLAFAISVLRVLLLKLRRGASWDRSVYLPLLVLSLAFVLNGAFSVVWSAHSLVFGLCEAVVYLLPSFIFSVGLSGECPDMTADYFAYISTLCVLLLSFEVLWLYIGPDSPVVGGEVVKSMIVFGWGIWTSAGAAIAVLIPAVFVGVVRAKHPYPYLSVATLALAAIYATHSRGALLFGLVAYLASLVFAARLGRAKRSCRVILAAVAVLAVGFVAARWHSLPELIRAFLSDNGRFRLWRLGISEFLSSPVFGVGFFGFEYPEGEGYFTGADFLPPMMHSTPVQLLSTMGVFGTVAYAFYRVSTLRPVLRDPSRVRLLVFFSAATMLLLSLVENYVFQFWPTLHYSVAIAVSGMPREKKLKYANK